MFLRSRAHSDQWGWVVFLKTFGFGARPIYYSYDEIQIRVFATTISTVTKQDETFTGNYYILNLYTYKDDEEESAPPIRFGTWRHSLTSTRGWLIYLSRHVDDPAGGTRDSVVIGPPRLHRRRRLQDDDRARHSAAVAVDRCVGDQCTACTMCSCHARCVCECTIHPPPSMFYGEGSADIKNYNWAPWTQIYTEFNWKKYRLKRLLLGYGVLKFRKYIRFWANTK